MNRKRLVICAIVDNAADRLAEWVAYHRLAGVEHFVLYDNASTDDPGAVVRALPMAEQVTLIRWPQKPAQLGAYRHFIDIFSPGFEWVAFLDLDQFLLPLDGGSVTTTLDSMSGAAAVLVHRRVFAPGRATGLAIERHDRRAADDFPANRHVRVIARCSDLQDVTGTPHMFRMNGVPFTTAGHAAPNAAIQPTACHARLVVNHYCSGDAEAWLERLRQENAAADPGAAGDRAAIDRALQGVADSAIRAYAPRVRQALGLPPGEADAVAPRPTEPRTPPPPEPSHPSGTAAAAPPTPAMSPPSPAPLPRPSPPDQATPAGAIWVSLGNDAQQRSGGLGLVFRDRSRPGEHWLAALSGASAPGIDPAFLLDDCERIRDFPSDAEARAACDAALAQASRH